MTYNPLSELDGTKYFEKIGLLGSATGMIPIISESTLLSAPDGYRSSTTISTIDSSVTQTATGDDRMNWNFLNSGSTAYSKVLAIGYGVGDYFGISVSENEYTGTFVGDTFTDGYQWRSFDGVLNVNNGVSWSTVATNAQVTLNDNTSAAPIIGIALYLEGTNNIQKTFFLSGGQWFQALSQTDSATGSNGFKSLGFYTFAGVGKRVVSPLMAWGVV